MKNDLGLSKGLLSSVSSLLKDSSKQRAEESKVDSEKLAAYSKVASMRPLSIEDAKVASYAAKAPERRVNDTITQLYTQSVAEHNAKQKAEAEAIKTAYGKMGAVAPIAEAKALSPKQKKIAAVAGDKGAIDAMDFKVLRARKSAQAGAVSDEKILDGDTIDELKKDTLGSYVSKAAYAVADHGVTLGYKAGRREGGVEAGEKLAKRLAGIQKAAGKMVKEEAVEEGLKDTVKSVAKKALNALTGGSDKDQLDRLKKNMYKEDVEQVEELKDTPGNSTHQCAIHVKHATMGEGRTLTSQHAQPDAEGQISWYTVMFEHGIEKVDTKDLEVLVSEGHMDHKPMKKKKM